MKTKKRADIPKDGLTMPMTIKLPKAEFVVICDISRSNRVSKSEVVRHACSLGLPKVKALFEQLHSGTLAGK